MTGRSKGSGFLKISLSIVADMRQVRASRLFRRNFYVYWYS